MNPANEYPRESISEAVRWQELGHPTRCRIVSRVREQIAANCDELASLCKSAQRTDLVETVSSELIPLCSALKWIGTSGPKLLRDKRHGSFGRPVWLWGVSSVIQRVPRGDVLILAAWNYPLLLPGVQMAQALASGNRVFLKPAPAYEQVTQRLAEMFHDAGVPRTVLQVMRSETQAAIDRINAGVDLVILTGSSTTGRAVLNQCAQTLTPTVLELSGCDAVVIGPDADLSHVAKVVRFGLLFNAGATCIGPRRLLVHQDVKNAFLDALRSEFGTPKPVTLHRAAISSAKSTLEESYRRGAKNLLPSSPLGESQGSFSPVILDGVGSDWPIAQSDLFAPIASILTYASDDEAVGIVNDCRYKLAASVFGESRWSAKIANRLRVGTVTINDIIFPTADPRLPFGGRGESGFGMTRGEEGLLEMTVPRVIATHRGKLWLHLMPRKANDFETLAASLTLTHGRFREKAAALRRLVRGVKYSPEDDRKSSSPDNLMETAK